jgi:hypothetical protein
MRSWRKLAVVVLAVAATGAGATVARADVDPASDVLFLQDIFLPYQPKVCSQLTDALRKLTATSRKEGYPVKVAVIGSARDLGGAPQLFGKPQEYAKFLRGELAPYSNYHSEPVLTVMPGGFGLAGASAKEQRALAEVSVPSDADPTQLARAVFEAIPKLAVAVGHPVQPPKVASGCSKDSGNSLVLIFIAPVALLLVAGLLLRVRKPRSRES